jgi:DNA polymerase III epsilon subunit-like protein
VWALIDSRHTRFQSLGSLTKAAIHMLRRSICMRRAMRTAASTSPVELFEQVQSGAPMTHIAMRSFVSRFFSDEVLSRGLSEARIAALDSRALADLLRSLLFEQYVAVPFSVFSFDLEFTGLPGQTITPTSIVEMAIYSPDTNASFTSLIRPLPESVMTDDALKLTRIDPAELEKAPTFDKVFADALAFMQLNSPSQEARDNTLLLSHGGKLADVRMLHESCEFYRVPFPSHLRFGDTYNLVRDLHRKRPVTKDKQPPTWSLADLAIWLKLDMPPTLHRALPDAKLTWDVLFHTLDRYGDSSLSSRQQLVSRYFAEEGRGRLVGLDGAAARPVRGSKRSAHGQAAATASASSTASQDGDDMFDMSESEEPDDGTLIADSSLAQKIAAAKAAANLAMSGRS